MVRYQLRIIIIIIIIIIFIRHIQYIYGIFRNDSGYQIYFIKSVTPYPNKSQHPP